MQVIALYASAILAPTRAHLAPRTATLPQVGIVDGCVRDARPFDWTLEESMERKMMRHITRGFPVMLLAAWMALAVLTLNSFVGFNAVMHP